jgi:hypothetical protein
MLHAGLITIHAGSGLIALVAGGLAVGRTRYLPVYFWSLVACILALAAVVASDWSSLDVGSRALFGALVALGGYIVWRGLQARRLALANPAQPSRRYLDHLGFTLVALLDAFIVITVLDLGAPVWAVAGVGVAGAVVGNRAIAALKGRVAVAP